MKKRAIVGLAVLVTACGPGAEPAREEGTEPPARIDFGVRPFLYNAPVYIALGEGYFAEEGLDVRVHMISGHAGTSFLSLDHGDIDVLMGGIFLGIFNAIDKGSGVRIVAGGGYFAPDTCSPWSLVIQKDLAASGRIRSPESLRGLRIDVNPIISEGYFVETYLGRGGLSLADVEIAEVPLASRQEAMNRASIDMTAISEPWLTRILADGHPVHVNANEVVPGLQFASLLFNASLLDERRELGRRFVAGYLRGVEQYLEGKTPRNIELVSEGIGLDVATLESACWPTMRADGMIETGPLQRFQEWGYRKGLLDRVIDAERYWDPSLIAEARARMQEAEGR